MKLTFETPTMYTGNKNAKKRKNAQKRMRQPPKWPIYDADSHKHTRPLSRQINSY